MSNVDRYILKKNVCHTQALESNLTKSTLLLGLMNKDLILISNFKVVGCHSLVLVAFFLPRQLYFSILNIHVFFSQFQHAL